MNDKVLKTLEYDKIRDMVMEYALSPIGKEAVRNLVPMTDLKDIRQALTETSDALSRIWKQGSLSFSGTKDIRGSLKRLAIGGNLDMGELLDIASLLKVAARVMQQKDVEDSLTERFAALEPLTSLRVEIERCIISEEEMADDASPELKHVRRKIQVTGEQIHNHLSSLLSSQTSRSYLQDALITMRNGRYCVPVKNEYRSQVPGMIHDQSSTGSTVFIEPMAVVKLNNELRELELQEKKEIEKVLASLSGSAAEHRRELEDDLGLLGELDFIFAKASFGKQFQCSCPEFNDKGYIQIKKGRHPLLNPKDVVPIDIHLGKDFNLLIITGPNTGGKTVSIKTVGLLTLMGQAGMLIPAFEGSQLAVFSEVFADIGDEQSIEQSLSTFSSHMTNIVGILNQAGPDSLVLFDELCAGTDPTEGAALAISILNFLRNMKVRTMATTHYSELKLYALTTQGVENASCEFDVASLRPTYRLLIGIPGKSNAFAISSKLGLPDFLIDEAKKQLSSKEIAFEDILSDLETSKKTIERDELEISGYKEDLKRLKDQLRQKNEHIDAERARILEQANAQAKQILEDAKDLADQSIRQINQAKASGQVKDMEKSRRALGDSIKARQSGTVLSSGDDSASPKKEYTSKDFHLGDRVKVLSLGLTGTVLSLPNSKGEITVQMGILQSQISIKDVLILEEADVTGPDYNNRNGFQNRAKSSGGDRPRSKTGSGDIRMEKSLGAVTEIHLIGMTVDEAIMELDKYMDDAYLAHLPSVRIVHGKGTGRLRQAVWNYLRKNKNVKQYRLGTYGEGESGVTIAEFK